jgi:outer membrane lipoprotein-sorting protein
LFDTSVFDVVLYDEDACWRAEMTPKRRDMKRMFSQLVFRFDKKTKGISRVEFKDASGDVTSIRFEDIKLNEAIGEKVFAE